MKMLFLAPSRLSRGDAAIAADLARQMPRKRFRAGFVSSTESMAQLHDLGMPTLPLTGETPQENLAILDRIMRGFRPDFLVAADAFAVNQSCDWSGFSLETLRERYDCPIGSIDRLGWQAADYTADLYGGEQVQLPRLLDGCDLLIRTCPPHAPRQSDPGVIHAALHRGGLYQGGLRPVAIEEASKATPVVMITNSEWEYDNPRQSPAVAQLIEALPHLLHGHLAALGRPVQVVHVGPHPWPFPTAEQVDYRHFHKLPYPMFHARLAAADMFLTTNVLSATLGRAVLAKVPSLVLQNSSTVETPMLGTAHPFRVAPLGWHNLLEPLLKDNPYRDCFATAEIFDPEATRQAMTGLLDDSTGLKERQENFHELLAGLPEPMEALKAVLAR